MWDLELGFKLWKATYLVATSNFFKKIKYYSIIGKSSIKDFQYLQET